jgi:rhomboid protease GluP
VGGVVRARPASAAIALVLIAVFGLEVAIGAAGDESALVPLGALVIRGASLADAWRIATFSFLHLTWLHLSLNVASVLWLGGIVERRVDSARMLFAYIVATVTSGITAMALGPFLPTTGILEGASGGVFGLLAFALLLLARAYDGERGTRLAVVTVGAVAWAASLMSGINMTGHFGGFVGGALVGALTRPGKTQQAEQNASR